MRSRISTASMAFTLISGARHSLSPITAPQASLHATDRSVAPPARAFDAGLRRRTFPSDAASLLPGLLAATRTGLTPAGDDELTTTDHQPTMTSCLLGARKPEASGRVGVRSSPVARRPAWSSARIGIRFGLAREGAATGPFFGPPSGRPIELTIIDIARVRDGKVVGAEPLIEGQKRHARSRAELPLAALKMSKGEPALPTVLLDHEGAPTDNPYEVVRP